MKPTRAILQTAANVAAALAHYRIPHPATVSTLSDRIICRPSRELEDRMESLVTVGQFCGWDFVRNHGVTAISGWRERVAACSMQIVRHTAAIEIDFDRFNPDMGAGPAFLHWLECVRPGKTDPFAIARGLRKRGIDVPNVKETTCQT